jgi:hypothetical protein
LQNGLGSNGCAGDEQQSENPPGLGRHSDL